MLFVTALYAADRERADAILERLRVLAKYLPLHVVCDDVYYTDVCAIPGVVPIFHSYQSLETCRVLRDTTELPVARNLLKDTRDYMHVINAKTECVRIVRDAGFVSPMYAWIDAGITKVLSDPARLLANMIARCQQLDNTSIRIPGCWPVSGGLVLDHVNWRFCGGFFVVPAELVDAFADAVLNACHELAQQHRRAIWEVNVWAWIESQGKLPIVWSAADHNDTIFNLD